jgi:hypothetical protein
MNHKLNTYRLDGEIKMLAPLSHIGESHGTDSYLAEQSIIGPDGSPEEVFVYSGNAFRGMMRDCGTRYLLDSLGGIQVPPETFHLLFSGGSLGDKTHVDIEQARMYRQALPLFSILGGGTGNQIIGGKLRVGQMYPITRECRRILPEKYQSDDLPSWRQWTIDISLTRKDDSKDESLRSYMHNAPLLLDGPEGKTTEKPQQMRYTVEALAPGSVLYQRTELIAASELELGAWVSCLAKWSQSPYLGGKSNVGFGLCEAKWEYIIPGDFEEWQPFAEIRDGRCILGQEAEEAKERYDYFLLQMYHRYIDGQRDELQKLLGVVS